MFTRRAKIVSKDQKQLVLYHLWQRVASFNRRACRSPLRTRIIRIIMIRQARRGLIVSNQSVRRASPVWPTSVLELEPAEALIVWALRQWALGIRQNCGCHVAMIFAEFARQLDSPEAEQAAGSFAALIRGLQEHARRRIRHHRPRCPCLGVDEAWLVCLIGACQRGELRQARALAEWMVHADGIGDLLAAATRLGRAMGRHDLVIPCRDQDNGPPDAASATVH